MATPPRVSVGGPRLRGGGFHHAQNGGSLDCFDPGVCHDWSCWINRDPPAKLIHQLGAASRDRTIAFYKRMESQRCRLAFCHDLPRSQPPSGAIARRASTSANWSPGASRPVYRALRGISSDFHEGVVTLWGRVHSFYMKQMAQEEAARVAGVEAIANHLEVEHQEAREPEARHMPRPWTRQR